jgi:hypothetical protein
MASTLSTAVLIHTAEQSGPDGRLPRRMQDAVAILVLAVTAAEIARSTFSLPVGPIAAGFVCVWLSQAVRRVIDWRRGRVKARLLDARQWPHMLLFTLGLAPWVVLPILHTLRPGWPVWEALSFPAWLRGIGVLLGVAAALAATAVPRRASSGDTLGRHGTFVSPVSADAQLFVLSMLLASGSPLVALLSAYWLAAYAGVWIAERWTAREEAPAAALELNC